MDFDFLSFLLGFAVGIGISYFVVWMLGRIVLRRLTAVLEQEQEEKDAKRIDIKVEQHGDVLYAFRSDNDGFVCQGADLAELRTNFIKKFPGQMGSVVGATDELHQKLVSQFKDIKNESGTGIGSTS